MSPGETTSPVALTMWSSGRTSADASTAAMRSPSITTSRPASRLAAASMTQPPRMMVRDITSSVGGRPTWLKPLLVGWLRPRPPDKPAGEPTGRNTVPVGGNARHDRRVVPVGPLHDPPSACRQVVANFRGVQPELAEVDDVEVGLVTDRDASPVQQSDGLRGLAAQHANRSRQVDLTLGPGVSHPVGQEVRRIAGVA